MNREKRDGHTVRPVHKIHLGNNISIIGQIFSQEELVIPFGLAKELSVPSGELFFTVHDGKGSTIVAVYQYDEGMGPTAVKGEKGQKIIKQIKNELDLS